MDATYLFAKNFRSMAYEDLPAEIVEITKKEILDTLGVALAGFSQPGPKELREIVQGWGGTEESSMIGCKQRVPAPNAAQVNATMVHARDYDDVHETAVMHPGVVSIPTALATAELKQGLSGREFITAVTLGVDMICRLGLATRPGVSPIKTGWHFTTLYGYPTAALTAGRILGLDEDKLVNAFGIAYHQCSGNGQCVKDGALTKRLGPGFAVRGGLTAALMADKGLTGARNCLEGEEGLFKVYHCGGYHRETLVHGLGTHFEGINVSIKPYPCCRGVHPSIDAALAVVNANRIKAEDVKQITIATGAPNHDLLCTPFERKTRPRNPVDAQFSIPWGVAVAMAHGRVTTNDFTEAAIKDKELLGLTALITAEVNPEFNHFEKGMEPARVTVMTKDGKSHSAQVGSPLGSPERPMSFEDCARKFEDCVCISEYELPEEKMKRVIDLISGFERLKDVRELISLLV
jgi:2-methylcitrate dehydratase PrpD